MDRGEAATKDDERYFAELLKQSPKEFVFGVYFVPEHIFWKDPACGTYVTRTSYPLKAPATYNHQDPEQDWYWVPKTELTKHVTGSYFDTDANIAMVSYTRPVQDRKGKLMGVAGVDISLETIQSMTNALRVKLEGADTKRQSAMLVDANGNLISYPDASLLAGADQDAAPFAKLKFAKAVDLSKPSGTTHWESNYIVWSKSAETGWTTVLLIPQDQVYAQLIPLRNQIALFSLFGLLALGLSTAWVTRKLFGPLSEFALSARKLTEGDCSARFPVTSDDEVGQLASILNSVVEHYSEMAGHAAALSEGNLTSRPIPKSLADRVGIAMGKIVDSWTAYVQNLKSNVVQLDDSIETLNTTLRGFEGISNTIENKVETSRESVEELVATGESIADSNRELEHSIQELRGIFKQVLENVEASSQGANSQLQFSEATRNKLEAASGELDLLQSKMHSTLEQAEMSMNLVEALTKKEGQIREITKTLTAISEQTRLLALNASIEAARAGTAGLGFAVVAKEVSQLAERSAESARHVDEILTEVGSDIEKVQGQIGAVTELVQSSHQTTAEGCKTMFAAIESIDDVELSANQNAKNMKSISIQTAAAEAALDEIATKGQRTVSDADVIVEQSRGVCATIESIRDSSQELSVTSSVLHSVASDVRSTSQTLQMITGKFVIQGDEKDRISKKAA